LGQAEAELRPVIIPVVVVEAIFPAQELFCALRVVVVVAGIPTLAVTAVVVALDTVAELRVPEELLQHTVLPIMVIMVAVAIRELIMRMVVVITMGIC
jgi:hypothetical protein